MLGQTTHLPYRTSTKASFQSHEDSPLLGLCFGISRTVIPPVHHVCASSTRSHSGHLLMTCLQTSAPLFCCFVGCSSIRSITLTLRRGLIIRFTFSAQFSLWANIYSVRYFSETFISFYLTLNVPFHPFLPASPSFPLGWSSKG